MFVHIGKNIMVSNKDIIMILDYNKIKKSPQSQNFLLSMTNQKLINSDHFQEKNIKTIIITTEKTYYSPIAAATLAKRI